MKFYTVTPKPYIKLRILATIFDYGIFTILFFVFVYSFGTPAENGGYQINGLPALVVPLFWFLYFVVLEHVNQATPGHDIFKLIVIKTDSSKISLSDAFKRRICDFLDIGLYGIPALICIYKTPKHQRLGDLLANTLVVKKTDITERNVTF